MSNISFDKDEIMRIREFKRKDGTYVFWVDVNNTVDKTQTFGGGGSLLQAVIEGLAHLGEIEYKDAQYFFGKLDNAHQEVLETNMRAKIREGLKLALEVKKDYYE